MERLEPLPLLPEAVYIFNYCITVTLSTVLTGFTINNIIHIPMIPSTSALIDSIPSDEKRKEKKTCESKPRRQFLRARCQLTAPLA